MRAVARFLGRLTLVLGWIALLLVAVLFLAERTGLLTAVARRVLADRIGSSADAVRVQVVRLGWFDGRVQFVGLELGEGGETARVESASVGIDLASLVRLRRLRVEDVDIRGGYVRISRELTDWVRGVAARFPAPAPEAPHTWAVPSVTVRDLMIDLDTRGFGRLPIGRVEAVVRSSPTGPPHLVGRLVPSLSSVPGASGEIFLSGQEYEPGAFDVHASAAGIPISTDYLPPGTEIEGLRAFAPRGSLALQATSSFHLGGRTPPVGSLRASLTDGEITVSGGQRIEGLRFDFDASYQPASAEDLFALLAWRGRATASGRWRDVPFEAVARFADPSERSPLLSCRVHVPRLPCTHDFVELFGSRPPHEKLWGALDPRGEVEVVAGFTCARDWTPGQPFGQAIQVGAEIELAGRAGLTYRGFESRGGLQNFGFPLPIEAVTGNVVYSFDPTRLRPVLVGIVDAAGRPEHGEARIRGTVGTHPVNAPPYLPGHGYAELDLRIGTKGLPADERLRAALRGLAGAVPPATTWEPFNPAGGEIDADIRLVRDVEMEYAAARVTLDFRGPAMTWAEIPAHVAVARGRFEYASDGHSEHGIGASFEGTARTASEIRAAIRYQTDPSVPPSAEAKRFDELSTISVRATGMSLTGDDKKTLSARFPWLGAAMDPHAPRGFADVVYERSKAARGAPALTCAEVSPRDAEVTPSPFPVPASEVRGRVLVTSAQDSQSGEARTVTRLAPLVGVLSGDVQVAAVAEFPEGTLRLQGAGIDPANKSLLGALSRALRAADEPEGPDLGAFRVEGPLDLIGEVQIGGDAARRGQSFRLFLRENSLQSSKNFRLDHLHGILEMKDRVLHGDRIEANLAGTPLELVDLRLGPTAEGFELTTRIPRIENLPLDRDHLRPFVDEKTLDALLGPLGWRGRIDVEDGRVRITSPRQGEGRLEFGGRLTPSDMEVQLGLPLGVRSASAAVDLVYEGGRVRAVCRIEDLYGTIAGRDLARATVLLTYVEPRLSIESLEGELEGGQIRPLGEGADRGGTAFSIDLEEPFPFQVALDLHGVELSGLLRGLFATSSPTRGKLDCRLRLTGDTQRILAIQGSGSLQVRESRLWSVPVFRALFSQLGIDDQAVFDRMATNIRVKNGVCWTDDITVRSPILELVGKGWIDFDGGLKQDLQVRYGLIDRLGPLRRLLYAIQKELLSVAIRGDLARPRVILKNPWTRVHSDPRRYRFLPLPGFTPLPPRF